MCELYDAKLRKKENEENSWLSFNPAPLSNILEYFDAEYGAGVTYR